MVESGKTRSVSSSARRGLALISMTVGLLVALPHAAAFGSDRSSMTAHTVSSPRLTVVQSTTNAGYALETGAEVSTVTATFTVPTVTCTSKTRAISLYTSLESTTGKTSYPWLLIECLHGSPTYVGNFDLAGNNEVLPGHVAAGDVITLRVAMNTVATKISFSNHTKGNRFGAKLFGAASATSGFVGIGPIYDGSGNLYGVPAIARLNLSNVQVDQQPLALYSSIDYNRTNTTGGLEVTTGSISASGTDFALTYNHP